MRLFSILLISIFLCSACSEKKTRRVAKVDTGPTVLGEADEETYDEELEGEGEEEGEEEFEEIEEKERKDSKDQLFAYEPMSQFTINLNEESAYLICRIELRMFGKAVPDYLAAMLPKVRHAIIHIISQKNAEEIMSSAGIAKMSQELRLEIADIIPSDDFDDLMFTEFIIEYLGKKRDFSKEIVYKEIPFPG